jgi:hypothetical protein
MILFLLTEFAAYVFVRSFRFYTANVHYNLVLPTLKIIIHMFEGFLFRQRNDEQPAGAKQAGWELFNAQLWRFFLSKKKELPACAKKIISEDLPNTGFYFLLVERSDIPLSLGQKGGSQEAQPPGWGLRKIRERK